MRLTKLTLIVMLQPTLVPSGSDGSDDTDGCVTAAIWLMKLTLTVVLQSTLVPSGSDLSDDTDDRVTAAM